MRARLEGVLVDSQCGGVTKVGRGHKILVSTLIMEFCCTCCKQAILEYRSGLSPSPLELEVAISEDTLEVRGQDDRWRPGRSD